MEGLREFHIGHAVCIDTWVCGSGWLTCLDALSIKVWKANQRGQVQTTWLEDYRVRSSG